MEQISARNCKIPNHVFSLIIAHSSCLNMLLTFSLSSSYAKLFTFLLLFCISFLLHMALKMFIATFAEFLLPAVDCGIFFFFASTS